MSEYFQEHNQMDDNFKYLKDLTINSNFSNNLLIYGQENTSLLNTIINFTKIIYCKENSNSYCNKCNNCTLISQISHPNVKFVFPSVNEELQSNKKIIDSFVKLYSSNDIISLESWSKAINPKKKQMTINKDLVMEAIDFMNTDFIDDLPKICIIWAPELLNKNSANTILKTLEEPKKKSFFILITENIDNILETIRSRTIEVCLKNNISKQIDEENIKVFINILRFSYSPKYQNLENVINDLAKYERQRLIEILISGTFFLTDLLNFKFGIKFLYIFNDEIIKTIENISKITDIEFIKNMKDDLENTIFTLKNNSNIKITIFELLNKINNHLKK